MLNNSVVVDTNYHFYFPYIVDTGQIYLLYSLYRITSFVGVRGFFNSYFNPRFTSTRLAVIMSETFADSCYLSETKTPDNAQSIKENIELTSSTDPKDESQKNLTEIKFNGIEISKLTKRQLKKYKKCLKWQETKKEKRAKQRLKNKEKKKHAKLNNIDLGPTRKMLKRHKMADSICKISVCIDLSFDNLMIDKDMAKTIKQILRIYTENRRAKEPMQLYLCDFNGRSVQEMEKHNGYEHWDINFEPRGYLDIFPKDKLIYLTSESDNIITHLEHDKVYIIGGLVDHNSHKGVCFEKAVSQGISHAQLPIGEYFQMKHRKVLTINQVFEIILKVSEGRSFKEALKEVIPKRTNIRPNENSEAAEGIEDSTHSNNSALVQDALEQDDIAKEYTNDVESISYNQEFAN